MIFRKKQYNSIMEQVINENTTRIHEFNAKYLKEFGYKLDKDILYELALKRLFECYTYGEIVNILSYFEQVETMLCINKERMEDG